MILHSASQQGFQSAPAPTQQADGGLDRAHREPELYGLVVEYLKTGHLSFLTFSSAFDRGLFVIGMQAQPVVLRPVTYRNA